MIDFGFISVPLYVQKNTETLGEAREKSNYIYFAKRKRVLTKCVQSLERKKENEIHIKKLINEITQC